MQIWTIQSEEETEDEEEKHFGRLVRYFRDAF